MALAGVYDVESHYRLERGRGVERISHFAHGCGLWGGWSGGEDQGVLEEEFTYVVGLFVHGAKDAVVHYASTKTFVETYDGGGEVKMRIFPEVDHVDLVMHLMFGGVTRDLVMDWMTDEEGDQE